MKIIIPMAGRGSRLRPHTLTIPKPLLPIAGKAIVQRIVEDLSGSLTQPVDEVAYIIGDFGPTVEDQLRQIAESIGAKCSIYYQAEPLGPGHAIFCAEPSLSGNCIVAFADTLFKADFSFDPHEDGVIWVQKVANPASFGVIKVGADQYISEFVEKSPVFVSDMAIVGIYYFSNGQLLADTLRHIITNDIRDKGEYQITTALELLKNQGIKFRPAHIEEWLDCGNKSNVVHTNSRMLDIKQHSEKLVSDNILLENAVVIPPCYIGKNVIIRNSVIGPYVSLGNNTTVEQSVIGNSIIQEEAVIRNANLYDSMLGYKVEYQGDKSSLSLGDYSSYEKSPSLTNGVGKG